MDQGGSTGKDKYTVSIDWELSKPRIKYGRKIFKDIFAYSNKDAESIAVEQWNSVKANSNKKVLSINSINMTELNKKPIMAQGGSMGWKHKMKTGGSLKLNGVDFSFLLEMSDKELVKRLDLIRKQQLINGKQYMDARQKGESTTKIEESGNNLAMQERAIIEARLRKNK
jgi:hypothetical protein